MEPFYYQHLEKSEQTIYHAIKTGLTALEDHFLVPYADPARISMIFFLVRLDCPEIFYAVTFKLRKWPQSDNLEILPEYLFDKKTIRQQQKAMSARVEKLARTVSTKTELEKELYIHDFICENIHYDKLKKPYSHEIIGPLGHGVGVCEGIAKSVKVLCDALGIWCIIVISEANPEKKIKYRHAWNIVKIGKTYYHLDATFDLSLSKTLTRHDYFNLSDDAIFRDHEPIMTDHVPCTDGSHFYYLEKKLSFTKQEEVKKRIKFLCQIRIFTQYFQIIHSYFLQFCLRLISHCFPSSASTVFMAAELNLHCRKSCSIRANTSGKHSISS